MFSAKNSGSKDNTQKLRSFSRLSNSFYNRLHQPLTASEIKDVAELLSFIERADYKAIASAWDKNIELMFADVINKNGKKTTPLKYALFLQDSHLIKLFFERVKNDTQLLKQFSRQANEQKTSIGIKPLNKAYANVIGCCSSLTPNANIYGFDEAWMKLGKIQRETLPIHMLTRFCGTYTIKAAYYRKKCLVEADIDIRSGDFRNKLETIFTLHKIDKRAAAVGSGVFQHQWEHHLRNNKQAFSEIYEKDKDAIAAVIAEVNHILEPVLLVEKQLLHLTDKAENLPTITSMLAQGVDPNYKNSNGISPLYHAVVRGHFDVVQALLAAGADVNAQTSAGATALFVAAQHGNTALIDILLAHDADRTIPLPTTKQELTDFAAKRSSDVQSRMSAYLANSNSEIVSMTPAEIAAVMGHENIVSRLHAPRYVAPPSVNPAFSVYEVPPQAPVPSAPPLRTSSGGVYPFALFNAPPVANDTTQTYTATAPAITKP